MAFRRFQLCPLLLHKMHPRTSAAELAAMFDEIYELLHEDDLKIIRRRFLDTADFTGYRHFSELKTILADELSHKDVIPDAHGKIPKARNELSLWPSSKPYISVYLSRIPDLHCACLSNQKIILELLLLSDLNGEEYDYSRLPEAIKTRSFQSGRGCRNILHILMSLAHDCFLGEKYSFELPEVVQLVIDAGIDVMTPDIQGLTAINILVKQVSKMRMPEYADMFAKRAGSTILATARTLLKAMPNQISYPDLDAALQHLTQLMSPIDFTELWTIKAWADQLCLIVGLSELLIEYGAKATNHTSQCVWTYASETIREFERRNHDLGYYADTALSLYGIELPGILELSNCILDLFKNHIHLLRLVSEGTVFPDEFFYPKLRNDVNDESSQNLIASFSCIFMTVSFVKIFVQIANYSSSGVGRSDRLIKCLLKNLTANGVIYLRAKLSDAVDDKESNIDPEHAKKSLMWLSTVEVPFRLKQLARRAIRSRMAYRSRNGVAVLEIPRELKQYLLAN